ncbi:HlyD family efflux transporter periplasmic adaptor subunit [Massilia sp. H-1]|nr:HlyD family efflux transporter periplasmic adaptor subunit [Massilia sp. H-1]
MARSRLLDLERAHAQLSGALAEDSGSIGRAERQIAELAQRRSQRVQEFQRDVRSALADTQKEAAALGSRMTAEQFVVSHVALRSPVDGVVLGMNVFTRGGVVAPGFKLMDVVPTGDALVVEGQLPVNLVDKVHPGLPVELIFSAFNSSSTPHIAGEITTVGADRLIDERSGAPYYKVSARDRQGPGVNGGAQARCAPRHAGRAVRQDRRADHDELSAQAPVRPRPHRADRRMKAPRLTRAALLAALCGGSQARPAP